jgi:hypothetical protein
MQAQYCTAVADAVRNANRAASDFLNHREFDVDDMNFRDCWAVKER